MDRTLGNDEYAAVTTPAAVSPGGCSQGLAVDSGERSAVSIEDRSRSTWLHLQPTHQPAGVGVEGVGDAEDVVEAEVALATFDLADVRPVQSGALGQLLLRQAQLLAAGAHTPTELTGGW